MTSAPIAPTKFPPGPTGFEKLKDSISMVSENVLNRYLELWEKYGDIIYMKLGPMHTYILANPEHIHHVLVKNQKNYYKGVAYDSFRLLVGNGLVTSDGDIWHRQRRLLQPTFTPRAIQQYTDMMVDITEKMVARWRPQAESGQPLNIDAEMLRLTTSIIGRSLFNIDLSENLTEIGEAFQEVFAIIPQRGTNPVNIPLSIPTPTNRRFNKNLAIVEQFVADQIASKRAAKEDDGSLLFRLLRLQHEDSGQHMDDKQLRDEIVTLFFAGFETTARTLTWCCYNLSQHPDVMDKLAAEADKVLNGNALTVDDLHQLQYTNMVINETLRLYPPVVVMPRQNTEADEIGGYHIPPNSMLLLLSYVVHRYPDLWEDPETFDPERFHPDIDKDRPKYAFIPFANGMRICIGNHFALLEMAIACATIAHHYRLEPANDDPVNIKFSGTISPDKTVWLKTIPR
ncbi:MAG TPA: cytochrome P450 [Anaerolineae bacterium]|nr:cytochrome P450 [Anaerolineae bacterium]